MQHYQRPLEPALVVFNFRIHRRTSDDLERPESIDNCTKDEVRCDCLRPPHKHSLISLSFQCKMYFLYFFLNSGARMGALRSSL